MVPAWAVVVVAAIEDTLMTPTFTAMNDLSQAQAESAPLHTLGAALLAAAMALPLAVQAESAPERGLISLKHLDYLDSQPGDSRIKVRTTALMVLAPITSEWAIGGTLTTDSISGASPAYQSSALTKMRDERHAVDTELTRYFPNGSLTLGANLSSESDYLSRGLSVQATSSNESKNTTWSAGIGFNSDSINPSNKVVTDETKRVTALLLGVTQVLTTHDIVLLNLGHSSGRGYFSDPYKFADNRPRDKNSNTLMLRWNHHLEALGATTRLSYRHYADNWGIRSHTLGLEYVQPLRQGWTVTPLLRLYSQSAASFYVLPDAGSYPFAPATQGYYSEDQRVSAFGAHTLGLKVAKQLDADWLVDLKFEQYGQRSGWRLFGSGSPDQMAFNARTVQAGLSRHF